MTLERRIDLLTSALGQMHSMRTASKESVAFQLPEVCTLLSQAGLSSRSITETLREEGHQVHFTTVARWIKKTPPRLF